MAFLDHVRQRVQLPHGRERLSKFTTYLHTLAERTDPCDAGSIGPVRGVASTPSNPLGTPNTRATADLAFSQLGGASWSLSRAQILQSVAVESGQILADYQTIL